MHDGGRRTSLSASARSRRASSPIRQLIIVAAALMIAACGVLGHAGTPVVAKTEAAFPSTPSPSTSPPTTAAATPTPAPVPVVDPGTLPQTTARPPAKDLHFLGGIRHLWSATITQNPSRAQEFFFPRTAYRQVKAIANPDADWSERLVGFYDLDMGAIRASLGPDAASGRLLGVTVPENAVTWVEPGEEYNRIGYWRVYGTTVRYEVDGREGTFGICSMISWRGEWYVVHLGPIVGRQPGVGALCEQ